MGFDGLTNSEFAKVLPHRTLAQGNTLDFKKGELAHFR